MQGTGGRAGPSENARNRGCMPDERASVYENVVTFALFYHKRSSMGMEF
jgi:hypothetical protein